MPEDWHGMAYGLTVGLNQDILLFVPGCPHQEEPPGQDARLVLALILGLWSELALHDQLVEGDALLQGCQVHYGDQEVAGLEEGHQPVGLGWAVDL